MQVTVEKADNLERRMKVQVPAEKIEQEVSSRLQRVARTARLKGFRPGKIPPRVLRKHYGGQVRREVLGEIMQNSYIEAIQSQKLNPAGGPRFLPENVEEGHDLEFTAVFEVYPEITLAKVEGLAARRRDATVSDTDIDEMIERLREQRSEWQTVDRVAADGDRVVVDFDGKIDGESFQGGASEAYPVTLGSGALLKDLEDGLIGMSADETRIVDVGFPDDYHASELAGKTAQFHIKAHKVEGKVLPEVDDGFILAFGIDDGGVDAFRNAVRKNMEQEAAEKTHAELRQQVLDRLVAENPLDVPRVLVDREVESMRDESMRRFGITDRSKLPPREPYEAQARKRVALGLLIGEVIRQREVKPEPQRLTDKIEELAAAQSDPGGAVAQIRADRDLMRQVEMMVLEEQVVDLLIEKGDIASQPTSFAELMAVK